MGEWLWLLLWILTPNLEKNTTLGICDTWQRAVKTKEESNIHKGNMQMIDYIHLGLDSVGTTQTVDVVSLNVQLFNLQLKGRYHGGRRPSSDDSFHSPTVIPPSPLGKASIMKRYHRRRTTRWGVTARSPTMVTLHDTGFVGCRWWNDGWTVKTVVTWRSSASMVPAPDLTCSMPYVTGVSLLSLVSAMSGAHQPKGSNQPSIVSFLVKCRVVCLW